MRRGAGWEWTAEWACRYVKAPSSWIREVTLSLVKTLLRVVLGRAHADVKAVAALDRGDKGAAATRPSMPDEVTPL